MHSFYSFYMCYRGFAGGVPKSHACIKNMEYHHLCTMSIERAEDSTVIF